MTYQAMCKKDVHSIEVSGHGIAANETIEHKEDSLESLLDLIESMESEGKHFLIY